VIEQTEVLEHDADATPELRALAAEDASDPRVRDFVLAELQRTGEWYTAIEIAVRERPDLVLMDLNMPEMNGYDFLCALRAGRRHAAVPVIMVTTETETAQVMRALEAGANEYVMKPFTKDVIREKLGLLRLLPA